MPELAEVELARRIWEPGIGQRILAVDSHPRTRVYRDTPASILESTLPNSFIVSSRTHGKRLLFSFGDRSSCNSTGTHPTTKHDNYTQQEFHYSTNPNTHIYIYI